jgi:hypothetical protein
MTAQETAQGEWVGGVLKKLADAVPFLHRTKDIVIRDQARTMLYQKPSKDERSGRDVGR